ncbi:MAG: amidohydrolase family protein [Planctomycetota bacterium]
MVTTLIQPDAVVVGQRVAAATTVLVRDGIVVALGHRGDADHVARVSGCLLPGLIDLQMNGTGPNDVATADAPTLRAVARRVAAGGAAAFLPTLITDAFDVLLERLDVVARWIETRAATADEAAPLGVHLEGPFLREPGVHGAQHLIDPTPERVDALLEAARGQLALVTLAPSRPGAAAAVAQLRDAGVAVALGHDRSAQGVDACVDAGARLATHLFNAMGPMHHRSPGLAGMALDTERLLCSLIPDGIHVDAAMLRNAFRCLGPERTVLVTDSVAGDAVPRGPDGQLAGSTLSMAEAVARWLRMVPWTTPACLAQIAAHNPARILGRADLGQIEVGAPARFALLDHAGDVSSFTP